VRMLADLADQRLPVFFRHPVARFNADLIVNLVLKNLFCFIHLHSQMYEKQRRRCCFGLPVWGFELAFNFHTTTEISMSCQFMNP
jgi:hypothetical protein